MTAVLDAPTSHSLADSPGRASRKLKNNVATVLVTSAFGVALIPLVWLIWTVVSKGYSAVLDSTWWTSDQRNITARDGGGGVIHAMLGTLEQVALCSIISVPLAILVAIYLVEYGVGRLARITSFMVDILSGVPSIVAALFIYAVFITTFGGQRAGYLVSLALVMLMIPVIVRTTEEMLKLVPNELREASYALGVPKWKTIVKIVLPTASSGIVTGIVLGIARVAGETAPLLILIGYNANTNMSLFGNNPQAALPTMIYDQFANLGNTTVLEHGKRVSVHFSADRMWGAALTLIIIVMALNLLARMIARRSKVSN
ncbi:MAG: phosphate transporter permease PtsA [Pseudonocardiales bacterium]|nr:phosphate transporter permease PtsA [Pseudonocardiales bacterium]